MGSLGGTKAQETSTARDQATSFVDQAQSPFLQQLRGAGSAVAGQQLGQIGPLAAALSQQLGGAGAGLLGQLGGIAGGGALPGQDFLTQRLGGDNPFLSAQIDQVGADIGRNFQQQILPGLRRDAVAVGGLGQDRDQLGQGLAAQGAQDAFARSATGLRFGDLAGQQQAAGTLQQGALAQQGIQTQAALGGLGSLGSLFGLGLAPFEAQFSPLQQLAQIIGGPTVLQQSTGQRDAQSTSFSFNAGVG